MYKLPNTISDVVLPMHHEMVARELEALERSAYNRGRSEMLDAFRAFAREDHRTEAPRANVIELDRELSLVTQFRARWPHGEQVCRDWIKACGLRRAVKFEAYRDLKRQIGLDPFGKTNMLPAMLRSLGCVEIHRGKGWVMPVLLSA